MTASGVKRANACGEPIQVEFFGLPGSGKTTIARELYLLLNSRECQTIYSPRTTRDQAPGITRTAARTLLIAQGFPWRRADWRAVLTITTIKQRRYRDTAKTLFNYLTVASLYRYLNRRDCSAVVDQGILQAIWSAHLLDEDQFSSDKWSQLLFSESETSRFYVCVQAPISTCMQRLGSRSEKHSRMQSHALLRNADLWRHAELVRISVLESLLAAFRRRGMTPRVMIVDGTRDPAELAAGIVAQIPEAQLPAFSPGR